MKDWLFYPFILGLAAAMIWLALSFASVEEVDLSGGIVIEGQDLNNLVIAPGHELDLSDSMVGQLPYAVIRSRTSREEAPSAGVFFAIPDAYRDGYEAMEVAFSVTARKGRRKGVNWFETGVFSEEGSSGWRRFDVTDKFEVYTFRYRIPANTPSDDDYFYFGIWADPEADGDSLEVHRMTVRPVTN